MRLGKHAVESHSNPGAQKELKGDLRGGDALKLLTCMFVVIKRKL